MRARSRKATETSITCVCTGRVPSAYVVIILTCSLTITTLANMAKPTFLQSLLNKPTQSYAFPAPKKDYHSQKKDLMRLAKAAVTGTDSRPLVHEDNDPTSSKVAFTMPSRSPAGWSAGYSSANSEVRHDGPFTL